MHPLSKAGGLLLAAALGSNGPATAGVDGRVPVVVELFTSQGCSSCPPADALLAELASAQPVAGARIIPLSQHVDYWNSLGWTDPFSSPEATRRQYLYADYFAQGRVYTPQMVVAGRREFVGSRAREAAEAIAAAAARQSVRISLSVAAAGDGSRELLGELGGLRNQPEPANVLLALTADGHSEVTAGENRGRNLAHVGVVHRLEILERIPGIAAKPGAGANRPTDTRTVRWPVPAGAADRPVTAVVFVQLPATGEIVGAAAIPLGVIPD